MVDEREALVNVNGNEGAHANDPGLHVEGDMDRDYRLVDRRDHVFARGAVRRGERRQHSEEENEHQAVAWVVGGLVYSPTERTLTREALRRHEAATRPRSRTPTRGHYRRHLTQ